MKINFDSPIVNLNGETMKSLVDKKKVDSVLNNICTDALLTSVPTPQNAPVETGRDKFKKFNLAKKIHNGGEVELTAEEVSLIKDQVGLCYNSLMVGLAWDLLEGSVPSD